jgi:hypothetical protein
MTKKWIAISLLLLGITGLLEWHLLVSVRQFNADNDLARIQPVPDMKQRLVQEKLLPPLPPPRNYLTADFAVIPEKNIFSESRSAEEKTGSAAPQDSQPLMQKPVLVGVTIMDDERRASIIEPTRSPQDRNRRAQIKRVGDVYQGYTITSIEPDQIVLESGTRKEIIPLHEGFKRGLPGKTAILSTRVVPIGGGGASGGSPVGVVPGSGGPARIPATPSGSPANISGRATALPGVGRISSVPLGQTVPSASQPEAQPVSPPTAQPKVQQAPDNRVIRTPFGDVIRPNRN